MAGKYFNGIDPFPSRFPREIERPTFKQAYGCGWSGADFADGPDRTVETEWRLNRNGSPRLVRRSTPEECAAIDPKRYVAVGK